MVNHKITKEEANRMLTLQDVSNFPINIFPSLFQDIIIELHKNANYNIDYTASAIFMAISASIGNSFHLRRSMEWIEHPAFWLVIVGKSGQNKSAPVKTAFKAMMKKQNQLTEEHKEYQSQMGTEEQQPVLKKLLSTDPTFEALIKMHEQNPHGIILKPDEFKSFITGLVGYSGGSKQTQHLSMWDGSSIALDRKGAESSYVKSPCVSIIGGIQNDVIASLKAKDIKDGFFERLLFVIPLKMEKQKNPRTPLNEDLINKFHREMMKLLDQCLEYSEIQYISLSKEAEELFIDEQDKHVKPSNQDSIISGILSKLDRYMLRFALVIEVFENLFNKTEVKAISKESMIKSIRLKEYFFENAKKLNNMTLDVYESNSKEGKVLQIIKAIGKREFSNKEFITKARELNIAKESYAYRLLSQTKLVQNSSRGMYNTEVI